MEAIIGGSLGLRTENVSGDGAGAGALHGGTLTGTRSAAILPARIAPRTGYLLGASASLRLALAALLLLAGAPAHAQVDTFNSLADSAGPSAHDFAIGLNPLGGTMYFESASSLYTSPLPESQGWNFTVLQPSLPTQLKTTSASYTASNLVDTLYVIGTRGQLSSYMPANNLISTSCTLSLTLASPSSLVYGANAGLALATNGNLYSVNPGNCASTQITALPAGSGASVYFTSGSGGSTYVYNVSAANSCSSSTTQACFPLAVYSYSGGVAAALTTDPVSGLALKTTITLPYGQTPGPIVVGPQDGLIYIEAGASSANPGQAYAVDPVNGSVLYTLSAAAAGSGKGLRQLIALNANSFLSSFDATTGFHTFATASPASLAMGSANVCTQGGYTTQPCSQTSTVDYDFAAPGGIVPSLSSPGGDFTLDSSSTCAGYLDNSTDPVTGAVYRPHCKAYINFAPTQTGSRTGLLQFKNTAGTVLAQTYLSGTGMAPAVAFYYGQQSAALFDGEFGGIALDGAGDVFTTDPVNNKVVEIAAGGAVSTVGTGLNHPESVAVDAGGNVYIADSGNNRVVEVAAGTGAQTTVGTGLSNPTAVAVDVAGNVYIGNGGTSSVLQVASGGGAQTPVNVTGLGSISSLAVDTLGDIYIADSANQQVVEVISGGGQTNIGGSWGAPSGVFVDGQNHLWVTDAGSNVVLEFGIKLVGSGWSAPRGVAVDASGDVFVTDSGNWQMVELLAAGSPIDTSLGSPSGPPSTTPVTGPLIFATARLGHASSDSPQSVVVENIGNQPLTGFYYMLGVGPASFQQLVGTGTPADCTPALSLAPGASCNISIGFIPQVLGTISGGIGFVDNAVTGGGFQTLALQGTGNQATPTVTWPSASAITYGQTLAASTLSGGSGSVPGSFAFTLPGIAPFAGTQAESVIFTPSDSIGYQAVSSTVSVLVNQAPVIISAEPTASSLNSGQTLASATLSGGTALSAITGATVPGSFAFVNPGVQPPVGSSSQSIVFTPSDASDYQSAPGAATVQVVLPPVAAPTFSPAAGVYSSAQSVSILDSAGGATIYYTTDGSAPTTGSAVYNSASPISVSADTTIKALAVLSHYRATGASASYRLKVPVPTFSIKSGIYPAPQQVSIADTAANALVWYTTDGTTPVPNAGTAMQFTGTPVTIDRTTTIKAVAAVTGWISSTAATATYTLKAPTPSYSPAAGVYTSGQSVTISDTSAGAAIWYTTDGSTPAAGGGGTSQQYAGAITVSRTTSIKAVAAIAGWTNSSTAGATYTLKVPTPSFSLAAGRYTGGQSVTMSDTNPGAVIWYTTDGSTPAAGGGGTSQPYTGAVTVSSTTTVKAVAAIAGWTNSGIASATYTIR